MFTFYDVGKSFWKMALLISWNERKKHIDNCRLSIGILSPEAFI